MRFLFKYYISKIWGEREVYTCAHFATAFWADPELKKSANVILERTQILNTETKFLAIYFYNIPICRVKP